MILAGIALYVLMCVASYGLLLGQFTHHHPYFNDVKWIASISLVGPAALLTALVTGYEKGGYHFRLIPLTVEERYLEFCRIYGPDYKDFESFRQEYR